MEPVRLVLGVDLGATNCRVSILALVNNALPHRFPKFKCDSASSLIKSLTALESSVAAHGKVVGACLAAAGPVSQNAQTVAITNWPPEDQLVHLAALPRGLFPLNASRLANDMEAGAMGLVALQEQGKLSESFKLLWDSATPIPVALAEGGAQNLVLAVGTGLGTASVCTARSPMVTPLEGGHSQFIACAPLAPEANEERLLFAFLSRKIWAGKHAPEWEDVLSGRGISYIYDFLTQVDHTTSAELNAQQIVKNALELGCEESMKTMKLHYKFLSRCSQSLTIILQAKAVFWMGDNLVANSVLVNRLSAELHAEFITSPKPQWVEKCPVFVQTKKENFNMLGSLYLAKQLALKST